jgi:hypothetical protein
MQIDLHASDIDEIMTQGLITDPSYCRRSKKRPLPSASTIHGHGRTSPEMRLPARSQPLQLIEAGPSVDDSAARPAEAIVQSSLCWTAQSSEARC